MVGHSIWSLVSCLVLVFIAMSPAIAADSTVDAVWSGSDGIRREIFFAERLNGEWTKPVMVTDDYFDNQYPVIDQDGAGVKWLFWSAYDNGATTIRYTTGGLDGWRGPASLDSNMTSNLSPSVIIDKDNAVWLAWSANNGGLDDIYYAVNRNGSWSKPTRLNKDNDRADVLPVIELDENGSPVVTWKSMIDGEYRLMSSTWNGSEWTEETQIDAADGSTPNQSEGESVELPESINAAGTIFLRVY